MKQREQALLLLNKAAEDEALLAEVLESGRVSDAVFGFHCQQAAEKLLKACADAVWRVLPLRVPRTAGFLGSN